MELEIQSKKENPLLDRTEVQFIVHHDGESTPKRELLRTELADKLNVKKENVVLDHMRSRFGRQETIGYAKIHKTIEKAKNSEKKHILKRNHLIAKDAKKKEEQPKAEAKPAEAVPAAPETPAPAAETPPADEKTVDTSKEEPPKEPEAPPAEETKPEQPPAEEPKKEEQPKEEVKEPEKTDEKKEEQQ